MTPTPPAADDRTRLLELVARIGALSGLRLPAEGLLREVAATAQALTRATGAVLAIRRGGSVTYTAAAGHLERHRGLELPADGSLSGLAMATRELAYSADVESDSRVHRERSRETGARSMVVAPLLHGPEAIGVLKVISDQAAAFDEIDEHATQMCAQFAAGVLARQQAVDERDRLLAQHRKDLEALQTILDASPAATLVHDLDGHIQYWNAAAQALLGWTSTEVIGHLPLFVPQGRMPEFLDLTRRIVAGDVSTLGPFERVGKDGAVLAIRVRGAAIRDATGTVRAIVRVLEAA